MSATELKSRAKKVMFKYANCNLNKNNPYYVNNEAIEAGKAWFEDLVQLNNFPLRTISSMRTWFKQLEQKYL